MLCVRDFCSDRMKICMSKLAFFLFTNEFLSMLRIFFCKATSDVVRKGQSIMDQQNVTFLETYKRLDKLCQELYDDNKGVTSYIDDLKQKSAIGRRRIPGWDHD